MSPEAIRSVSAVVQPLVFETGIDDAPYSTAGTAFLVKYERRAFVITARHLLRPEALTPLCIFPSDTSRRLIPLKDIFFLPVENVGDDYADFAVIEIDLQRLDQETAEASVINLELAAVDWYSVRDSSTFVVLGYPIEHAFVDYETELLSTKCLALSGKYARAANAKYLHDIEIDSDLGLSKFSGFSGAPVFSWFEYEPRKGRIALCGMAVQGTPTSKRVRFLDWAVIRDAIKVKCSRADA
jgi:hypothetical protein